MNPRFSRPLLTLLAATALSLSGRAQTLELTSTGGATLGGLTTLSIQGNPGDQYVMFVSLTTGPTPLPPPHQPSSLDVGLELAALSFSIPGFTGFLDGSGSATIFLPIPFDVVLLAIPPLNFQAVRIVNGAKIDGKSNLCRLVPAFPQTTVPTIGAMTQLRAGHIFSTVKADDGNVYVFGGSPNGQVNQTGISDIDRYNPCLQAFEKVADMVVPRNLATATKLLDGRILIVGGGNGPAHKSAEIFDPATGTSTLVASMTRARALHQAVLLPDGRVFVSGGTDDLTQQDTIIFGATDETEIYDPATDTWIQGPSMAEPRVGHRMDVLQNGTVLVTGGYSHFTIIIGQFPSISDSAEIYIPGAGAGAFGATLTMAGRRFGHNSAVATSGRVYLFGGATDLGAPLFPFTVDTVERFDPTTNTFTLLPAQMSKARGACAVAQIGDLMVVAGGSDGNIATPSPNSDLDVFDASIEGFVAAGTMQHVRSTFSATALDDQTILFAGGGDDTDPGTGAVISFGDAEIFHP